MNRSWTTSLKILGITVAIAASGARCESSGSTTPTGSDAVSAAGDTEPEVEAATKNYCEGNSSMAKGSCQACGGIYSAKNFKCDCGGQSTCTKCCAKDPTKI